MPVIFSSVAEALAAYPTWPWEFFRPEEIACKESGTLIIVPEFMNKMDDLRRRIGKPIVINSWYRSPEHNAAVSTTGLTGPHTTGRAVDISELGEDALLLTVYGYELGFTGFGWKQKGGGRFVHMDDLLAATNRPRPWTWTY